MPAPLIILDYAVKTQYNKAMTNLLSALKFFDGTYILSWGDGKGITFYGFFIALSILLGGVFGYMLSKKRGYPTDTVIDILLWCVPLAVIGARVYYIVFTAIDGYKWTFGGLFDIKSGGLAIYGAILFAILGGWLLSLYYKKRNIKDAEKIKDGTLKPKPTFFQIADLGAPFFILGQAIGRIGCYFSQCCYGNPVTNPAWQKFPFASFITDTGGWHLATYFYESAWCLLGLGIMIWLSLKKKRPFDGFVFSFYLMFYGAGRFALEFLRTYNDDTLWLIPGKIQASMAVAVVMFVWGAWILGKKLYERYKAKQANGNKPMHNA